MNIKKKLYSHKWVMDAADNYEILNWLHFFLLSDISKELHFSDF